MADMFIAGKAGELAVRSKGLGHGPTNVVVLVQGANLSGQLGYDFSFPGATDYSVLDALVARGLGAITFSVRGYGKSQAPADPLSVDTDAAIEDLGSVMAWARATGYPKPHLVGWSWGGRICGRYAETCGDGISRLVLLDPALGGGDKIPLDDPQPWWSNTFDYFMERLEDIYCDPAAKQALARQAQTHELRSPNGIRVENARGSIPVNAARITSPTLMLYGEAAGRQNYMQGGIRRTDFFESLATTDKSLVVLPEGGDYLHLQNGRLKLQRVVADFLLL